MTQFVPKAADYRARVTASFARQHVMQELGITLAQVEPGFVELAMPFAARLTQQHGFVHAGILATALDSACGYAAFSLMPPEAAVLTVEFKINLLAPAAGERFLFRGQVIRPGRSITVCEGRALGCDGTGETLIATMTGTLMAVFGRDSIKD